MNSILIVKHLHHLTAMISITGFIVRGVWMLRDSRLLHHRLTKVLPHINDTLFLIAGIWLAVLIHQYPFVHSWLTAKVVGLVAYIGFGTMALKHAPTKRQRLVYFLLAILTFAYIFFVAMTKSPLGPLSLL